MVPEKAIICKQLISQSVLTSVSCCLLSIKKAYTGSLAFSPALLLTKHIKNVSLAAWLWLFLLTKHQKSVLSGFKNASLAAGCGSFHLLSIKKAYKGYTLVVLALALFSRKGNPYISKASFVNLPPSHQNPTITATKVCPSASLVL